VDVEGGGEEVRSNPFPTSFPTIELYLIVELISSELITSPLLLISVLFIVMMVVLMIVVFISIVLLPSIMIIDVVENLHPSINNDIDEGRDL